MKYKITILGVDGQTEVVMDLTEVEKVVIDRLNIEIFKASKLLTALNHLQ